MKAGGLDLGCACVSVAQSCLTPAATRTAAPRLLCPWDSPGKATGVGSHSLLQWIFLNQGSNTSLLHCRQILYSLSLLMVQIPASSLVSCVILGKLLNLSALQIPHV